MAGKQEYTYTYCNPLPLPDCPRGFPEGEARDYRDQADPSVLFCEGKWFLYATMGSVYVSEDFRTWKSCEKGTIPPLSAPAAVKCGGKFYLMGSNSPLYVGDGPLGPFEEIGMVRDQAGRELSVRDPMLFADGDGRLYLYWGLGPDGIYGMELDADCPVQGLGTAVSLISFREEHEWERLGAWNQNREMSFIEGAWMFRHGGKYYLIYSASGTCYRTYAWGVYQSDSPLGGFVSQSVNPVLRKRYGLVTGTGHGCVAEGPGGTLWAFYTIKMCYASKYERRIGMDPAGFTEDGDFFVGEPSETPQWAPGVLSEPERGNAAPLLPLTAQEQVWASSCAPGRDALYALDESMLTWWQPGEEEEESSLTVDLRAVYQVSAVRLIFRDVGLNYDGGVLPGPFGYLVEGAEEEGGRFETLLDRSRNGTDCPVDYQTFETKAARYVRLTLTSHPPGILPGVVDFTAFGSFAGLQAERAQAEQGRSFSQKTAL